MLAFPPMPKANEVGNVKTEMVGLSWKRKEKLRERQLISSRQRAVGVLLIVLGVLVFAVGLFGYLAGDLQLSSLSWLSRSRCMPPGRRRRAPAPR